MKQRHQDSFTNLRVTRGDACDEQHGAVDEFLIIDQTFSALAELARAVRSRSIAAEG